VMKFWIMIISLMICLNFGSHIYTIAVPEGLTPAEREYFVGLSEPEQIAFSKLSLETLRVVLERLMIAAPAAPLPPPPPPPPPGGEIKGAVKGLTEAEVNHLTPDEVKKSDTYLIKRIKQIGVAKNRSVKDLMNEIKRFLDILSKQGAQALGFRFKEGNSPDNLKKQVLAFIEQNLIVKDSLTEFLNNLFERVQEGSLQDHLLSIFENWVLGDKKAFKDEVRSNIEQFIINFGAAQRKVTEALLTPESLLSKKSDDLFVAIFMESRDKEEAAIKINRLRINPYYLKFGSLQDDIKGAPIGEVETSRDKLPQDVIHEIEEVLAKRTTLSVEEIEARLKQRKEERASAAIKKELPMLQEGILSVLKKPLGTYLASQVTSEYLKRYLFNPDLFEPARSQLKKFLQKTFRIVQRNLSDQILQLINFAEEYDEIVNFFTALSRIELKKHMTVLWKVNSNSRKVNLALSDKELEALNKQIHQLKVALAPSEPLEQAKLLNAFINALYTEMRPIGLPRKEKEKLKRLESKLEPMPIVSKIEELSRDLNNLARSLERLNTQLGQY
jgi:hypothetical protein